MRFCAVEKDKIETAVKLLYFLGGVAEDRRDPPAETELCEILRSIVLKCFVAFSRSNLSLLTYV